MPRTERAKFLNPLIVGSTHEAANNGATLALIRPRETQFKYKKKSPEVIDKERRGYVAAANQLSFLTQQQNPLEPCPYEFRFKYATDDGHHDNACGDWETAAMFYKFKNKYGEENALKLMGETFNDEYPAKGMVFALGTDSRYPSSWLLVGVIRLDEVDQLSFL